MPVLAAWAAGGAPVTMVCALLRSGRAPRTIGAGVTVGGGTAVGPLACAPPGEPGLFTPGPQRLKRRTG